jgi:hypothetical protein
MAGGPSPRHPFWDGSDTDTYDARGYRRRMDEARAVLDRLDRIEELERERAPAAVLLAEVRALLAEAEAWVRAEPAGTERAQETLGRCRETAENAGRTLVA